MSLLLCATQLDSAELEHIRHVFERLDLDGDGYAGGERGSVRVRPRPYMLDVLGRLS